MSRFWLLMVAVLGFVCMAASAPARADGLPPLAADDIVLGKDSAPITIIEYASMSCPHCAEFEEQTWPQLKKNWIETGKAKYVFRDFPLNGPAFRASLLARCAPRPKFYGFIEILYANQAAWAADNEAATMAGLERFGLLGGVSEDKFKACEADTDLQQKIAASEAGGQAAGVDATPTFFINGKKLAGAVPYDTLNQALLAAQKTPADGKPAPVN